MINEKKLLEPIKKYAWENNIRKVLIGLSGGSDSVSLLVLLKNTGLDIMALHCNFNLRGEESLRDENFVKNMCLENNIPLETVSFDVEKEYQLSKGRSVEMICRDLRYEWFHSKTVEFGADRIAVGHNADDNIETFFLNLLRGSGTSGLKGMEYDNGKIWRPLLYVHKNDLLKFLESNNLEYITDSSNLVSDFRRNYLRNEIIPLFKKEWPGFDKALDNSLKFLYAENKVVEAELSKILDSVGDSLAIETINKFPDRKLLVRRFIQPLKPFATTASEIIEAIDASKPHSPKWILPFGKAFISKNCLKIVRNI